MKKFVTAISFALLVVMGGCAALGLEPDKPQTAEAFCSSLPSVGFGNFFYCATGQGNLQGGLPNGALGYCQTANTNNLGLVGYSATTTAGGAAPVSSFSAAQDLCNALNVNGLNQCQSIIRCTRQ